jgi:hypothetical protein
LAQDLLVNDVVGMMVRILLFLQRESRRPRRVPRVGPSSSRREVRSRRIRAASSSLRIQCFMSHDRSKHIEFRFNFIRDCV